MDYEIIRQAMAELERHAAECASLYSGLEHLLPRRLAAASRAPAPPPEMPQEPVGAPARPSQEAPARAARTTGGARRAPHRVRPRIAAAREETPPPATPPTAAPAARHLSGSSGPRRGDDRAHDAAIVAVLTSTPGLTAAEIGQRVGIGERAYPALQRLLRDTRVVRDAVGCYTLSDTDQPGPRRVRHDQVIEREGEGRSRLDTPDVSAPSSRPTAEASGPAAAPATAETPTTPPGAPPRRRGGPCDAEILRIVRQTPGLTATQISTRLQGRIANIYAVLLRLERERRVTCGADRGYRPVVIPAADPYSDLDMSRAWRPDREGPSLSSHQGPSSLVGGAS